MLTLVGSVVGTMVGMSILGGLVIRYALLPYIISHAKKELTDPITVQLASIVQLVNEASQRVGVVVTAWDGHLDWSQREVDAIWRRLEHEERMGIRPQRRPTE